MQTDRTGRLARIRKAPLHERSSVALGDMFGAAVRELTYCLAEGDALTGVAWLIATMAASTTSSQSRTNWSG